MIQALLSLTGQDIFNVVVFIIGAFSQLIPAFREWWDNYEYRDRVLFIACIIVAGVFVCLCWAGIDLDGCVFPVWPDGVMAGMKAALDAFALFMAAQILARMGRRNALALRAALR